MPLDIQGYEDVLKAGAPDVYEACKGGSSDLHLLTFEDLRLKVAHSPAALRLIDLFNTPQKAMACIKACKAPYSIQSWSEEDIGSQDMESFDDESATNEKERNSKHHLPKVMLLKWKALQEEAEEAIGIRFRISSAARSQAYQMTLLCELFLDEIQDGAAQPLLNLLSYAAPPFASKHNLGMVIDIPEFRLKTKSNPFGREGLTDKNDVYDLPEYKAFVELAAKYNFYPSYPKSDTPGALEEPWEFIYRPS